MSVRRSWNALLFYPASEFLTWTSGWKCATAECNGGSRGVKNGDAHPGVNSGSRVQNGGAHRMQMAVARCKMAAVGCNSYPDMLFGCPPIVYPDALSEYTPYMDSKELSSISDFFGDQKAIKTRKLNTIWLELFARVLNMLIGLKGDNYYSKVFKRVNYKLWNITFWVVITLIWKNTNSSLNWYHLWIDIIYELKTLPSEWSWATIL